MIKNSRAGLAGNATAFLALRNCSAISKKALEKMKMVNKDLATLAGEVQLVALEKGFLKEWERGPFCGMEYKNNRTNLSVFLEISAEEERNLYLALNMGTEIVGDGLPEIQDCVDRIRIASGHLRAAGYNGTFSCSDNNLDFDYKIQVGNIGEACKILTHFTEVADQVPFENPCWPRPNVPPIFGY